MMDGVNSCVSSASTDACYEEEAFGRSSSELQVVFADTFWWFVTIWGLAEIVFYLTFRLHFIPKANQRTKPTEYREPFAASRMTLLRWILDRILSEAGHNGRSDLDEPTKEALTNFLLTWFKANVPEVEYLKKCSTVSSSDDSSADSGTSTDGFCQTTITRHHRTLPTSSKWLIPGLTEENLYSFLAWVLFGKNENDMDGDETLELQKCFNYLEGKLGITFDATTPPLYHPRRMTLEDVSPWHRPLLVYALVLVVKSLACSTLWILGFRFVRSQTGLTGYVRRGNEGSVPLVFFHGIAPAGFSFYLPFVLNLASNRPCLIVENPNISCSVGFSALTEKATVEGVEELTDTCFPKDQKITLVGHSFGSCPISWLLSSPVKERVRDVMLLDPVTILLSESDVMINFLYSAESFCKIRMVASSELFTEYYLRRHFSWYNSELWLKEFTDVPITVCLAENDEIVPSAKVFSHCRRFPNVSLVHWKNVGHAAVVCDPGKWKDVKQRLKAHDCCSAS